MGSVRMVTNTTGTVLSRADYLPYGEEITVVVGGRTLLGYGQGGLRQRFTGKEGDAETGLDYFGARCFSGAQGRFTGPDPFLPMIEFQPESDDEEAVEEAKEKFNQYP